MPLQHLYRPPTLEKFYGNEALKESLLSVLNRKEDVPPAFLFTGPSGCGKTTLARIVKNKLKIENYIYFNASNTRGIETIRDVIDNAPYYGLHGGKKLYVFDECFAKGTKVTTMKGKVPIEKIRAGDKIQNVFGIDTVEKVFTNMIPLSRIVSLSLSNGKTIVCTEDHKFLTNDGWKKAKLLDNSELLWYRSDIMSNFNSRRKNEGKKVRRMPTRIYSEEKDKSILFQSLLSYFSKQKLQRIYFDLCFLWKELSKQSSKCKNVFKMSNKKMSCLQHFFQTQRKQNMFYELWFKIKKFSTKFQGKTLFRKSKKEIEQVSKEILQNSKGNRSCESFFGTYEKEKSHGLSQKYKERLGNKTHKRLTSYLERKTGWIWSIHNAPTPFSYCFGMGNGSFNLFEKEDTRLSYQLQSGYRKTSIENGNRGRWEQSSREKSFLSRQKKGRYAEKVRVESVTFYKQRSNERSFSGIISNTERDQGFVEFYDLQVKSHPSYIANGCMVHNCHQITPVAQEGLLMLLEEPPKHVHIVLCTTEPNKLKITLKRRCFIGNTELLKNNIIKQLLTDVLKEENVDEISDEIVEKIINEAGGSPGIALKLLDSIIDVEDEDKALEMLNQDFLNEHVPEVIELCRALMKGDWQKVQPILKDLKMEPEASRHVIMGYFKSVMLKNPSDETARKASYFMDNFFDAKELGLVVACWEATRRN